MRGLSLAVASGGHSSSRCTGLSPSRPLLLWSTGSRRAGSVVVAHGPSCSAACGILPDQGSNPCPLHWQADSQPLRHQGSPQPIFNFLKNLHTVLHSSCSNLQCKLWIESPLLTSPSSLQPSNPHKALPIPTSPRTYTVGKERRWGWGKIKESFR